MKLEDAIKLGLGLKGIINHASTVTMQEALTTMATELELLRTQYPVAIVDRVHGQMCLQFVWGKTLYDMPVGMQLFAHPMVALKHSHEKLKIKDDLIASLEAKCKDLEQKLAAQANVHGGDDKPKQTSRYDWSKAPEWAMWAATDENGKKFFYEDIPVLVDGYNFWTRNSLGQYELCRMNNSDWQSSLEQRPQSGVELVHPKFPPVRHGVGDIVESDYPFDGATIQNVKPARFVETNAHEIDLKRVQCISRPDEKGRYFVTLVSGIELPVDNKLYPHAVLSAQWKAYGEAN